MCQRVVIQNAPWQTSLNVSSACPMQSERDACSVSLVSLTLVQRKNEQPRQPHEVVSSLGTRPLRALKVAGPLSSLSQAAIDVSLVQECQAPSGWSRTKAS